MASVQYGKPLTKIQGIPFDPENLGPRVHDTGTGTGTRQNPGIPEFEIFVVKVIIELLITPGLDLFRGENTPLLLLLLL